MAGRRQRGRQLHGILLLDKRQGVSSNRALQEVRRLFDANKAGHTGSLDPLATGLLPVCFGEATKVSTYLLDTDKKYRAEIRLGVKTDSGDTDGRIIKTRPVPELNRQQIESCLRLFIGDCEQVPPMYSALKVQGKRLYELARAGQVVERKVRQITIYDIELLRFSDTTLTVEVACSKGTYIRTLAEDIGEQLGCGATISALRRLQVGCLNLENAQTFVDLQTLGDDNSLLQLLLPVDTVLTDWPGVELDSRQAQAIVHGQSVQDIKVDCAGLVRMYSEQLFLGIGELLPTGILMPKRVFNLAQH